MSRQTNCPACRAPVTAEGSGHYDDPVGYYFDHTAHQFLKDDVARLEAENATLRGQLANAKAHARRMVKGRKAAEAKYKALRAAVLQAADEAERNMEPSTFVNWLLSLADTPVELK